MEENKESSSYISFRYFVCLLYFNNWMLLDDDLFLLSYDIVILV